MGGFNRSMQREKGAGIYPTTMKYRRNERQKITVQTTATSRRKILS
jgi:hypothetical protein